MAGATRLNPNPRHGSRREEQQPTTPRNMFSKPLNASPVQQLKNATAGALEKTAFIEHQKQSQNGPWKKPFKAPRVFPGAHQVLLAGSAVGSWIT